MSDLRDDELLELLGSALVSPRVRPDAEAISRLHQALTDAVDGVDAAVGRGARDRELAPIVPFRPKARKSSGGLRRLRHPAAAAVVIGVLSFSSVAAAVSTDTLPGPTRNVAYDLGLPVTSPALYGTQQTIAQLRTGLDGKNPADVRGAGEQLARDLRGLPRPALLQVRGPADALLQRVGVPIPPSAALPPPPGSRPGTALGPASGTRPGTLPGTSTGTSPGTAPGPIPAGKPTVVLPSPVPANTGGTGAAVPTSSPAPTAVQTGPVSAPDASAGNPLPNAPAPRPTRGGPVPTPPSG